MVFQADTQGLDSPKARTALTSPSLSIVIPTFNEAENLPTMFFKLAAFASEHDLAIEAIVVDDSSPDGTGVLAEEFASKGAGRLSVRVLNRDEKLGLSSALFDGIRAAKGDWVATMDADDSHDTSYLAEMLRTARSGADVIIGSRYAPGGRIINWPLRRRFMSLGATYLARLLFRMGVKDPMSGYALIRRDVALQLPDLLRPGAYKFLLELLVRVRPASVEEVPIVFRNRRNGESKLTNAQVLQYVYLVCDLLRERKKMAGQKGP